MNRFQEQVAEFSEATGGPETLDTAKGRALRANLIMEEAVETVAALGFEVIGAISNDIETIARFQKTYHEFHLLDYIDGLCDLTYVTMGGAISAGINLERHFEEVHQANMRKLTGPKREDGKQLKPEGWQPPDHERILSLYGPVEHKPWGPEGYCYCGTYRCTRMAERNVMTEKFHGRTNHSPDDPEC